MGRVTLKGFTKTEKEIIKANAEVLKARIEEALPLEIKEPKLRKLALDVSVTAYWKYMDGYVSYEELNGTPKLIYVKLEGYQWKNRKDKDEQKVIVVFNDCVAMYYDVEGEEIGNTQAVTDWSNEERVKVLVETN
ncbi:hypothetical protein [Bacillus phage YungSlug]|nr:hypothetical protein [Bacillus phage YungSlug]